MEIGESDPPKIPFGTDMETLDYMAGILPGMEDDPLGPPVNSTIENFTDNFINTTWIFGPTEDKVILPLLLSLIALCAFLANGLVVFTILSYQRMRTGPNLMIMNIAIADIVFAAFCIPTAIVNHSLSSDEGEPVNVDVCKFVHYVIFVTIYVGIYTLVVTCVFRFFAEYLSTKFYQLLSKTNAVVSCLVIWIAFSISHLNFIMQQDTAIFQEPFICLQTDSMVDQMKMRTLWVTFLSCAFLLPLLTILILSAITMHLQSRAAANRDRLKGGDGRSQRELTNMVMASMVMRTVCWLPIQVFVMVDIFGVVGVTELYRKAEMLAVCCAFGGSAISALVYSCVSVDFRLGFQETTSCLFTKKEEEQEKPPINYKLRQEGDVNETIMSILTDSSNHINYA